MAATGTPPAGAAPLGRTATQARFTVVLQRDELEEFRALCADEMGTVRRTSGDGATADVMRRLIREYVAHRKAFRR
jgi:hypothetical protein